MGLIVGGKGGGEGDRTRVDCGECELWNNKNVEYSEKLGRVDCSHEVKLRARK